MNDRNILTKDDLDTLQALLAWLRAKTPLTSKYTPEQCAAALERALASSVEPAGDHYVGEAVPLTPPGAPQASVITGYNPTTRTARIEPGAEPSIAALRMELAECRALLVETIADPSEHDIKRAADWLSNWNGKRIDVGAESERIEVNRSGDPA